MQHNTIDGIQVSHMVEDDPNQLNNTINVDGYGGASNRQEDTLSAE